MVFLCHYRNKLIFGFKSEGGDSGESEEHVVSGDVSRGMAQWQANSSQGGCLCTGAKHWISQLMFTMLQEMREQDNAQVAGCGRGGAEWVLLGHGRTSRGRLQLWHSLGKTLTRWEERSGSSCLCSPSLTMRVAPLALRLMCLAWLWPLTQLNSSHFPNKRRHKEMYIGENTKQKQGGWAKAGFSCVTCCFMVKRCSRLWPVHTCHLCVVALREDFEPYSMLLYNVTANMVA